RDRRVRRGRSSWRFLAKKLDEKIDGSTAGQEKTALRRSGRVVRENEATLSGRPDPRQRPLDASARLA
ncbi:MAG TPA: hypothetical protein VGC36_01395, partial [Rhizomicrobium sp.]